MQGTAGNGTSEPFEYLHIPHFIACTAIGFEPLAVSRSPRLRG